MKTVNWGQSAYSIPVAGDADPNRAPEKNDPNAYPRTGPIRAAIKAINNKAAGPLKSVTSGDIAAKARTAVGEANELTKDAEQPTKVPVQSRPTAAEWNAEVMRKKNEKLQNNGDEMLDKKFTEDLHSRKSDGRFIESSGKSKPHHRRDEVKQN